MSKPTIIREEALHYTTKPNYNPITNVWHLLLLWQTHRPRLGTAVPVTIWSAKKGARVTIAKAIWVKDTLGTSWYVCTDCNQYQCACEENEFVF